MSAMNWTKVEQQRRITLRGHEQIKQIDVDRTPKKQPKGDALLQRELHNLLLKLDLTPNQ